MASLSNIPDDPNWRLKAAFDRWFDTLAMEILARSDPMSPTAMYVRFWETYLCLRRMTMESRMAQKVARGEMDEVPENFQTLFQEYRQRLIRAVAKLVAQGKAKGELRRTLDEEAVADWFLMHCAGAETTTPASAMERMSRFDTFWRPIASHQNVRSIRARPIAMELSLHGEA